eukprot:CAMPEP_0118975164 /NCGR_PEP_ID=MMETSP1173-20130426/14713_1 /TAXON_ID=1034831 /ORGANISM="Rhizochromulina marina cf, Strain CCMP1243" /LENGTH=52 /DNA_ID=CAMNT_0006925005 /DNA_START=5 /DNA_END=160 /DNA_ORIENTATION=-
MTWKASYASSFACQCASKRVMEVGIDRGLWPQPRHVLPYPDLGLELSNRKKS